MEVLYMRYLVVSRSNMENTTPEELEWVKQGIKQFRDDSHTKAYYGFAGEPAGCLICECNSNQELNQYLNLNPLSVLSEWEIHPLVTADETLQVLDMVQQQMKAMVQAA